MDASADGNAAGEGDGAADPALGPPEKMAEHREELTPMTAQYFDLCQQYDESLVLFQVGDFYEAFCGAAETIARILEITLTKREDSTGEWPMAGIPIDSAESYIETLLESGYRVAVADQVEDPDETTGLVDRAVTRIVTPGTLTEDELLRTTDNNYVACLTEGADEYGLALLDVSTGDFYTTSAGSLPAIADEIGRFEPAEAIVGPDAPADPFDADCMVTPYERRAFDAERAREKVADYFGPPETLLAGECEVRACGALLAYAEYARAGQDGRLEYLNHLTRYDPREYMLLDAVALRSLELFERRAVHGAEGAALVDVVDETSSALGSRKLKDWLRRPLVERADIEARHDAVDELRGALRTREQAASLLREVYDIERLISRVSRGRADARDLRALKATLDVVPRLRGVLQDVESEALTDVRAGLDDLPEVRNLVGRAIREDPPTELTEGDLIREGYSDELDELRATERSGKEWIDSLERQERERTGIDSLKVGHNSVHGYYIEVTNPNLEKVPDDYQRRQTLKNSERFYTPELKEREEEIFRAEGRADDLELELFREVREAVGAEAERVQALAGTLATLDALVAFGDVAAKHGYTRPAMGAEGFAIEGGRHPVVERTEENFVPNDTRLAADERVAVITGPNMAGKSTYMRQVALVSILAQAGSFVPAEAASLPVVDRVFTRVGASDDIAGGRSTFMVEMAELSDILQNATEDSLVLLDEVGRGTSTADGLAIARAVTEYVHDEVRATTLFATHHHELTETAAALPEAVNLSFDAEEVGDEVTFSHEVSRGAATASYGIEVAKTAGVPDSVIDRARELLGDAAIKDDSGQPSDGEVPEAASETRSLEEFTEGSDTEELPPAVAERLREVNLARTTPIEALTLLNELQDELRE